MPAGTASAIIYIYIYILGCTVSQFGNPKRYITMSIVSLPNRVIVFSIVQQYLPGGIRHVRKVLDRQNPAVPDAVGENHAIVAPKELDAVVGRAQGGIDVDVHGTALAHARYHSAFGGQSRRKMDVGPIHRSETATVFGSAVDRLPGLWIGAVHDAGEGSQILRGELRQEQLRVDEVHAVPLVRSYAKNGFGFGFCCGFLLRGGVRGCVCRIPLAGVGFGFGFGFVVQASRSFLEFESLLVVVVHHEFDVLQCCSPQFRMGGIEYFLDRNKTIFSDAQTNVQSGVSKCPRQGTGDFSLGHGSVVVVAVFPSGIPSATGTAFVALAILLVVVVVVVVAVVIFPSLVLASLVLVS
mmetsp:Transcript_26261/g.72118  ORF Transcript_26261/g.72118 Transcript_26261/m.72118 type:complete len:353 (+) Transcript_26261:1926-2984(+)